jgi:hypothetical protein
VKPYFRRYLVCENESQVEELVSIDSRHGEVLMQLLARALKWLESSHLTAPAERDKAKDALKWAALTYVVAALGAIELLIQDILIYQGRSCD